MLVQCGILTHINTSLLLKKYKIVELDGCVVVGITVIVTHDQSRLVNVVVSSIGHLFIHDASSYLTIANRG